MLYIQVKIPLGYPFFQGMLQEPFYMTLHYTAYENSKIVHWDLQRKIKKLLSVLLFLLQLIVTSYHNKCMYFFSSQN